MGGATVHDRATASVGQLASVHAERGCTNRRRRPSMDACAAWRASRRPARENLTAARRGRSPDIGMVRPGRTSAGTRSARRPTRSLPAGRSCELSPFPLAPRVPYTPSRTVPRYLVGCWAAIVGRGFPGSPSNCCGVRCVKICDASLSRHHNRAHHPPAHFMPRRALFTHSPQRHGPSPSRVLRRQVAD